MIDWASKVFAPNIKVFGQPATVTQAGVSQDLSGIFDEAYADVDVVDGMPVTTTSPCLGVVLTDLPFVPAQRAPQLFILAGGALVLRGALAAAISVARR